MNTDLKTERSIKQTVYRTAVYLRISREDGDKNESDSISNQRKLIYDYIKDKSEFCIVDEYADDGFSGSNFERPSWKQLYEDLECGAVNCIIVKDLSRFGRNYIEVGRYLQMIFPALGVRLIAVNDNFDSLNEMQNRDTLTVPIKNLINDIYCRDISKKVTTQLSAMRKRGECVASFLPYGYKRNPEDHSKLIIDEAAAKNVKQIFIWKLEGCSDKAIADKLNEQGVLSPYEYKIANGEKMFCGFKKHDKAAWSGGSVYTVLHNEYYKGTMVQGKRRKLDCRLKEQVWLPKNEWTRVEGTHEPIVDPELFELVQELMKKDTRTAEGGTRAELLSGFLFCGKCGRQMTLKPAYYKGKKYRYYACRACSEKGRKPPRINEAKIYRAILEAVRKIIDISVKAEKIINEADSLPEKSREAIRLDSQLLQLKKEIKRYTRIKGGLYEDYKAGILTLREYTDYLQIYKTKIDDTKKTAENVTDRRRQLTDGYEENEWIRSFKKNKNITSLERPVLAELTEKVLIWTGGRIEIVFKNTDFIEAILEGLIYEEGGKEAAEDEQAKTAVRRAV